MPEFLGSGERMDVSVIIPTFNRALALDDLLGAVRRQSTSVTFEVLVVDNGSTDATREVAERHAACDARVHYLHERRPGASNARNTGIAAATAPILAFLDDDVRPRHDWVESVARAFSEHPEVDCIGGRVEPRWPCTPPPWLTQAHWPPLALPIARGTAKYLDREHASACLITANFACRSAVFRDLGGLRQNSDATRIGTSGCGGAANAACSSTRWWQLPRFSRNASRSDITAPGITSREPLTLECTTSIPSIARAGSTRH